MHDISPIRVLIVDDALFMRGALKEYLTRNGFEIVGMAETGYEAIRLYDQVRPDIVTMDLTMPDMNGLEALKQIRMKDSKARIVVISSMGQDQMIVEAMAAGACQFMVKPIQELMLAEMLRAVAENSGEHQR
jgi:two-component system, chemotaxis family, chemotaxis protein CheY